ncbi:MAG: hypothetical protein IT314_10600 [Anaerolineales bacterium]|nr:hypothetical protein [Anaerolineales bacterium]
MKNIRYLLVSVLSVVIFGCTTNQSAKSPQLSEIQVIDEKVLFPQLGLSFAFPSSDWDVNPYRHESKADAEVISFWRKGILDSSGREIVPVLGIVVGEVPEKSDIVEYSAFWRANFPKHQVDDIFTKDDGLINLPYAIGYKIRYTDQYSIEHTIFLIHAIKEKTSFQISLDSTTEMFPQFEGDFIKILKSIEYIEK